MDNSIETEVTVNVIEKEKIAVPSKWKVVLLNDDYTPIDFVVSILIDIFNKSHEDAVKITLEVHNNGRGIAGIYTLEVADQKISDIHVIANKEGYPLRAIAEQI